MSARVDIGREAVERMARWHELEARALRMHNPNSPAMPEIAEIQDETAALILALRAALDAAERERDEAHYDACRKALAHPAAVLALLDRLERMEGALRDIVALPSAPALVRGLYADGYNAALDESSEIARAALEPGA